MFNDQRVEVQSLQHWLDRHEPGPRARVSIQQGGLGERAFCEDCNSKTGSWYGSELTRWVRNAIGAMGGMPPIERLDASLTTPGARLVIKDAHPLRFVKQVVAMVLATNGVEFARHQPDLRAFVLDRHRQGVPAGVQLYLAIFLGPIVRLTGTQQKKEESSGHVHTMSEIAFPPFAYLASFDEPAPLLPAGNITNFGSVGFDARARIEIDMLVGFGHTIYPTDYRTRAMRDRDREQSIRSPV